MGNRTAKHVERKNGDIISTYYVRDAQSNIMASYTQTNTQEIALEEQPIYGSSRLGVYHPTTETGIVRGNRIYEGSNHLGNVLVTFSDRIVFENGDLKPATVSYSDYYAFGMPIKTRTNAARLYKSAFNGQVKDDEIYGEGNTYSAQYWEYDARLGRRWNLDPKPNPSISDYACFANNPIFYSDPLGDTIRIKFGGFLGIGRKTATYNEKDQKFYDKNGIEISTNNKFYNTIQNAFNEINKGMQGQFLLSELAQSEHTIKIKRGYDPEPGYGHKFRPKGGMFLAKRKADKGISFGGTIRIQMKSDVQIYIAVAHEGGHGFAAIKGRADYSYWKTGKMIPNYYDNKSSEIPEVWDFRTDEQTGMHWENIIRAEHGLKLREYYDYDEYDGIQGPALIPGTTKAFFNPDFDYNDIPRISN